MNTPALHPLFHGVSPQGEEKFYVDEVLPGDTGSPPRGRGKVFGLFGPECGIGITPAWAGKSGFGSCYCLGSGDHPRMGGEKAPRQRAHLAILGSPPRGRGKVMCLIQVLKAPRITPAWAGKSVHLSVSIFSARDHPRVGGEKSAYPSEPPGWQGSPPRGRGKVLRSSFLPPATRITPAWAGKSFNREESQKNREDHPRVGGEKEWSSAGPRPHLGSPPRGRGKAFIYPFPFFRQGITPAWAGKR